jgi:hypothetical protein
MGVFNSLRKKDEHESPTEVPSYEDALTDKDEEYGQQQAIKTGWTGDGHAGANEYPSEENYRTLGRWRACVILITIEVGIGVLSLPSALQTLGLIPGIIAIFGFGGLTTYCGYIMVQFYRRYPMVSQPSIRWMCLLCSKEETVFSLLRSDTCGVEFRPILGAHTNSQFAGHKPSRLRTVHWGETIRIFPRSCVHLQSGPDLCLGKYHHVGCIEYFVKSWPLHRGIYGFSAHW